MCRVYPHSACKSQDNQLVGMPLEHIHHVTCTTKVISSNKAQCTDNSIREISLLDVVYEHIKGRSTYNRLLHLSHEKGIGQ